MKKIKICSIIFLILLVTLPAANLLAQEDSSSKPPVASSYDVRTSPFALIILGTRNSQDVDVIRQNLSHLVFVKMLVPSFQGQKHIEFEGQYAGPKETLIAEVKTLISDRYDMETRDDKSRGVVITLRKIQNQPK